jgi:hypothetical protein
VCNAAFSRVQNRGDSVFVGEEFIKRRRDAANETSSRNQQPLVPHVVQPAGFVDITVEVQAENPKPSLQ